MASYIITDQTRCKIYWKYSICIELPPCEYLLSCFSMTLLGTDPTISETTSPSLKNNKQGMLRTEYIEAVSGLKSVSIV